MSTIQNAQNLKIEEDVSQKKDIWYGGDLELRYMVQRTLGTDIKCVSFRIALVYI